jgi:hypothetical protein
VAEWWLGQVEESLRLWEQAFVGYRRSREPHLAVVAAVYLCLSYRMSLGNDVVAQGWSRGPRAWSRNMAWRRSREAG